MLVLTATPIPRTLVLTYFGDMDVSELREKPAGRQPIDTRTIPLDRLDEVIEAVGRALDEGQRVYWVCPLVEESETSDLAAAEERFDDLQQRFGDARRSRPRPDEGHRQGRRDGALRRRRDAAAGRDHGDRGRRRRAGGDRDGDRARRALRPRAAPPVARPHRPRQRATRPACCSTARRSARPPRRGSPSCARPRTASASPRRTCSCAAKATCSARARAACRASASRRIEVHGKLLAPRATTRALILTRDPQLQRERGEALRAPALSVRARRGDPADRAG